MWPGWLEREGALPTDPGRGLLAVAGGNAFVVIRGLSLRWLHMCSMRQSPRTQRLTPMPMPALAVAKARQTHARTAQVRVPFMQVGTALLCSRSTTMEVVAALLPSQKERRYSSKKERRRSFHEVPKFFRSGDAFQPLFPWKERRR